MLKKFLSKLFGERDEPKETKLSLNDLESRIKKLKDNQNVEIISEGKTIINNMNSYINQARINLKKLAEKQIDNQDKRAYDITKGSRKVLVTHISGALNKIIIPKQINYSSLKELNNSITLFFNFVSKDAKSFFYTSLMLGSHTEEVKDVLMKLDNENKRLKEILDSENIRNLNKISEKINQLRNNDNEIKKLEKEKDITERAIKHEKQTNIQLNEKLENIRNSEVYKDFLSNEEKIKKINGEKEHTQMRIRTEVSPLVKPLKKFENMETDKNKVKNISMIIQDPVNFSLKNYLELKNIFKELKELILNDKIHLDKKEKKLNKIKEIENGSLDNLLENYKKLNIEFEECNKRKFSVLNKISELESKIKSFDEEILKTKIVKIKDSIEKIKQDIISERQRIQELCLKIGENVILE